MLRKAQASTRNMVFFGDALAHSETFKLLFREGMLLVEEAAAYLDGPGRRESSILARGDALAYASEIMRLTTRLMQLASWLLLQRAVNEGELSLAQARTDKHRVSLSRQDLASSPEAFARLPQRLQELTLQSQRLQERIIHFDRLLDSGAQPSPAAPAVLDQIASLQAAFGARH